MASSVKELSKGIKFLIHITSCFTNDLCIGAAFIFDIIAGLTAFATANTRLIADDHGDRDRSNCTTRITKRPFWRGLR